MSDTTTTTDLRPVREPPRRAPGPHVTRSLPVPLPEFRRPGPPPADTDASAPAPLVMATATELVEWQALSRVRGGNVVRNLFGAILDGSELLPRYLLPELLFGSLERIGWVAVAESDVLGVARISLTDTGRERYEQLLGLRQPAPCRVLLN